MSLKSGIDINRILHSLLVIKLAACHCIHKPVVYSTTGTLPGGERKHTCHNDNGSVVRSLKVAYQVDLRCLISPIPVIDSVNLFVEQGTFFSLKVVEQISNCVFRIKKL